MKFGKKILEVSSASEDFTPKDTWMDYKRLKKLLKTCEQKRTTLNSSEAVLMKNSAPEQAFFKLLFFELQKVEDTYKKLEVSALQNFLEFFKKVEKLRNENSPLKESVSECLAQCAKHHLTFVLLENFAVMNYCGFTKILKKHDKVTGYTTREKFMTKIVDNKPFARYSQVHIATQLILKEVEFLKSLTSKGTEKESKNSILVDKGLELKQITEETIHSNEISLKTSGPINNRLDDLVSLLEKHQRPVDSTEENDATNKRKRLRHS